MAYTKRTPYKKKSYARKRSYKKSRSSHAFSSNKSTMVKLTSVLNVQAAQLKVAPLVFSTHAPVYWQCPTVDPNPAAVPPLKSLNVRSFNRITNALSLYETAYLSSMKVTAAVPSDQNTTYQFVRNNIPIAINDSGQILNAQIQYLANNVVDSSRFVCNQWGGNRSTTYQVRNKFDAVWLFKSGIIQDEEQVSV